MKMTRLTIAPADTDLLQIGRVNLVRIDTTTDKEIALQQAINDAEIMEEIAKFVRRVRSRLGVSRVKFSRLINVSVDTVSSWEHSKRYPVEAAKALLKMLDRFPEQVLAVLS